MKSKNRFSNIIHFNRDENSYTARLFESYLFPYWHTHKKEFSTFVQSLKTADSKSQAALSKKFKSNPQQYKLDDSYSFVDGMLFLENLDVYAYCQTNNKAVNLDSNTIDKTEFDCVIVAEDNDQNEILFVFEIKCFTNLKKEEVDRQNKILKCFKRAGLYKEFYHFSLISEENFCRSAIVKDYHTIPLTFLFKYIKEYIKPTWQRFNFDIEFEKLHCRINKGGHQFKPRKLIDKTCI